MKPADVGAVLPLVFPYALISSQGFANCASPACASTATLAIRRSRIMEPPTADGRRGAGGLGAGVGPVCGSVPAPRSLIRSKTSFRRRPQGTARYTRDGAN